MNKAILMSIQPQHAVNILKGKKTLELRKTVPKDFKGWVNIYVSRGKDRLSVVHDDEICKTYYYLNSTWGRELNGEVVARFWFDECDMYYFNEYQNEYRLISQDKNRFVSAIMGYDELCLTENQVNEYGKGKELYAWHIKRLEIFDKPMELSDFYRQLPYPNNVNVSPLICGEESLDDRYLECIKGFEIKRPPQSWQYVYVKEKEDEELENERSN